MAYFDCQIVQGGGGIILVVTCDPFYAGATITATDGETTLQATCPSSSPYTVEFKIPNSGSWTISGTASGETRSITVVIPDSATLGPPVPTGSTVTPVNDIQIWLHCADIWDKTYTTITQVLADASTLQALIASNNAADYMARSTSWATSVAANSNAMTYIGANNYCANKLLANSTWLNAICNSTYFESVLNVKVPTMTSNTTPSGVASSDVSAGANPAYWAFDSDLTHGWYGNNANVGHWVQYAFPNAMQLNKVRFGAVYWGTGVQFKISGSNDGNNFTDLKTEIAPTPTPSYGAAIVYSNYVISNNTKYKYIRVTNTAGNVFNQSQGVKLQFWGR